MEGRYAREASLERVSAGNRRQQPRRQIERNFLDPRYLRHRRRRIRRLYPELRELDRELERVREESEASTRQLMQQEEARNRQHMQQEARWREINEMLEMVRNGEMSVQDDRFQQVRNSLQGGFYVGGLTPERLAKFQHFDADQSMVGERCVVCLDDLEVGTKMVRLGCHADHCLCKSCAEGWFKCHNTCPICRRVFN